MIRDAYLPDVMQHRSVIYKISDIFTFIFIGRENTTNGTHPTRMFTGIPISEIYNASQCGKGTRK